MTKAFFTEQFAALVAAFLPSQRLSDVSQAVYWEMLQGIPEDKFANGVRKCLATCKFFPTIAELGDAALPKIKKLGPYNPYAESIVTLDWRDQVKELAGNQTAIGKREKLKLPAQVEALIKNPPF